MTTVVKGEHRSLTLRQQKGRAVNAVAEVLRKRLLVPNIYLEPRSPYITVDVLAVDRAGSGDLHAAEIRMDIEFVRPPAPRADAPSMGWIMHLRKGKMKEIHAHIMSLPAHFRYLAIPQGIRDALVDELGDLLYSPDGIGRIGIITVTDRGKEPPVAELSITPERFRVDPAKLLNIETKFLAKVRPDIEVRI
jgi:hypothetical protein